MGGRTPGGVGAAEINKLIGGFGHLMLKYTNLYVKRRACAAIRASASELS